MEPDQSPNQRLNPPDPSSDRSSAAPNREGKSRGQAAKPATTAATAHTKKCCGGAAPRRAARAPAPAPRTPPRLCIACSLESTGRPMRRWRDRKSTRLNSSHTVISYAVFCLKKKKKIIKTTNQKKIKKTKQKT